MGRVIKFRAWYDGDGKKGMYFPEVYSMRNNTVVWLFPCDDGASKYISTPLMQFTGFKDIKGFEIFEGDIVDYISPVDGKRYKTTIPTLDNFHWFGELNGEEDFVVLGNKFENSELLENK